MQGLWEFDVSEICVICIALPSTVKLSFSWHEQPCSRQAGLDENAQAAPGSATVLHVNSVGCNTRPTQS